MQESSLLLSLFNRIALQNKANQNPGKQISLQNKQTTSDLKAWLCCVMYVAEKDFMFMDAQGGKHGFLQPEQKSTQLRPGAHWSITGD